MEDLEGNWWERRAGPKGQPPASLTGPRLAQISSTPCLEALPAGFSPWQSWAGPRQTPSVGKHQSRVGYLWLQWHCTFQRTCSRVRRSWSWRLPVSEDRACSTPRSSPLTERSFRRWSGTRPRKEWVEWGIKVQSTGLWHILGLQRSSVMNTMWQSSQTPELWHQSLSLQSPLDHLLGFGQITWLFWDSVSPLSELEDKNNFAGLLWGQIEIMPAKFLAWGKYSNILAVSQSSHCPLSPSRS